MFSKFPPNCLLCCALVAAMVLGPLVPFTGCACAAIPGGVKALGCCSAQTSTQSGSRGCCCASGEPGVVCKCQQHEEQPAAPSPPVEPDQHDWWTCIAASHHSDATDCVPELIPGRQFSEPLVRGSQLRIQTVYCCWVI